MQEIFQYLERTGIRYEYTMHGTSDETKDFVRIYAAGSKIDILMSGCRDLETFKRLIDEEYRNMLQVAVESAKSSLEVKQLALDNFKTVWGE